MSGCVPMDIALVDALVQVLAMVGASKFDDVKVSLPLLEGFLQMNLRGKEFVLEVR